MKIQKEPLSFYVDLLASGKHYTFARYGDGEWNAIKGKRGCNCDKHEYFPALGKGLKHTLLRPIRDERYLYALQTQTDLTHRGDVQTFFREHLDGVKVYDSDVFHAASEAGELYPLVSQLNRMHNCIVGPKSLRCLSGAGLLYQGFIEIQPTNCFHQRDYIRDKILKYSQLVSSRDVVYCFSASMLTEILTYELWPTLGKTNWLIDFGSLWDVYAGTKTRKYHSRIPPETIKKNVGQK